jgi:hypothetical protein
LKVARRREAAKLMRRAQNFWSQPIDERKNDDSAGSGNSVGKDLHRQMAVGSEVTNLFAAVRRS